MRCRHCGNDVEPATGWEGFATLAQHLSGFHGIVCSTYAQVMEAYSPTENM